MFAGSRRNEEDSLWPLDPQDQLTTDSSRSPANPLDDFSKWSEMHRYGHTPIKRQYFSALCNTRLVNKPPVLHKVAT